MPALPFIIGPGDVTALMVGTRWSAPQFILIVAAHDEPSGHKPLHAGTLSGIQRGEGRFADLKGLSVIMAYGLGHVTVDVGVLAAKGQNRSVFQFDRRGVAARCPSLRILPDHPAVLIMPSPQH